MFSIICTMRSELSYTTDLLESSSCEQRRRDRWIVGIGTGVERDAPES